MKIRLNTDIELVIDDDKTLNFSARKLTKKESKTFSEDVESLIDSGKEYDKLKRKLKYLNAKNEFNPTEKMIDDIYNLEEEIADYGNGVETKIADKIESLYKKKLNMTITGDDAKDALELGETIGYMVLNDHITDAIEKGNEQGN